MRLQVLVHGGPFDGHLLTHSIRNETPVELVLADLSQELENDKAEAHLYRLVDDELHEAARTTFASYSYLRPIEKAMSLVDVWILKESE